LHIQCQININIILHSQYNQSISRNFRSEIRKNRDEGESEEAEEEEEEERLTLCSQEQEDERKDVL